MAYATPKQNNSNNIQKINDEQQANNGQQGRRQDPRKETMDIQREDTGYTQQDNEVLKHDMEEQSQSQTNSNMNKQH